MSEMYRALKLLLITDERYKYRKNILDSKGKGEKN